jgi:hypothetical protein
MLAHRQTWGLATRAHQQALATGPFGNTYEAGVVSPEQAMRGLQDINVYNQGNIKRSLLLQQHNMHLPFTS